MAENVNFFRMLRRMLVLGLAAVLVLVSLLPANAAAWSRPFYWGVATAGFQSEGSAPDSNWARYVATSGSVDAYGNATDFRHRYAEDIQLAADMGVNTFRFSVEWARVEPRPGVWDQQELAYYDDVIAHIRAAGTTPMVTLSHWVYPGWVEDRGGFADPRVISDFTDFAGKIVQRYRNLGVLWVTFNEPVTFLGKELQIGALNPLLVPVWQADLVQAHRRVYDLIHQLDPTAKVTSNQAFYTGFNAATDLVVLDQIKDKVDFVGLDYYYGASLDNLTAVNAAGGQVWNVKLQPEGIYDALRYYANRYPNLPLYIVENGMPTDNGQPRADGYTREAALRDSIFWVQRAKADGMNVIGYNYWSITDNYEWGSYEPRFGLYTVDVTTDPSLTRRPTAAVPVYRQTIAEGGVPAGYQLVQAPGSCSLVDPLTSCLVPANPNGPLAHLG